MRRVVERVECFERVVIRCPCSRASPVTSYESGVLVRLVLELPGRVAVFHEMSLYISQIKQDVTKTHNL